MILDVTDDRKKCHGTVPVLLSANNFALLWKTPTFE